MDAVRGEAIVAGWDRDTFGMLTFRIHTTDYPEIGAEGRTPGEACNHLIRHLIQAMDFTSEPWKHQPLGQALADARSFAAGAEIELEPFTSSIDLTPTGSPAFISAAGAVEDVRIRATP